MHRLSLRPGSFGVLVGALALLAHCGGDDLTLPSETTAAQIAKLAGDNQTGAPGAALRDSLVVKVVDSRGDPVPDQRVAFAPDGNAPGASVSPGQSRTDTDGITWARWTLGSPSGTQAVVASVVGADALQVRFQATVRSGAASSLAAVDGDGQTAAVGTALTDALVVKVTDQFGNPVADVRVDWDAQDGSVDPSSSTTGADGLAQTSWVLGSSTGPQTATASSADLAGSPVTFSATAVPGSANQLVRISGNDQSGRPGEELDQPLVVRLVDQEGNGIADRAVTWVVGAGGGSVSSTTSITDGDGQASARWTLGSSTGTNTLNAVVSGIGVVGFTATATNAGGGGGGGGASPSRLVFQVQPSDAEEDRRLEPPIEVAVLDQDGHLVTGEQFRINLELRGDDGKLKGDRSKSTHSGVATFDDLKVDKDGDYRIRASTDGLPSVDSDQFHIRHRDHDGDD